MTAYGNIEKAVSAMRDGAVDYLAKPFEAKMLVEKVEQAVLNLDQDAEHEAWSQTIANHANSWSWPKR